MLFCPRPPPDGYAALLSDGERKAKEDSARRRDFQDSLEIAKGMFARGIFINITL